jgi:glycosyltransferase involved in cell wall biosynthesis
MTKIVDEYKLSDRVFFLGWMNNASSYIHEFDIFVLPSIYEGMPLSIIEAMASKVAVIASDISGNIDLIENNRSGKLFKSNNLNDLKNVLIELIKDDKKRNKLSKNAYESASENYKLSIHCKKLSYLYLKNHK